MPLQGPPPRPVVAAIDAWHGFGVFWHGCDGSTWDLVDQDNGVVLSFEGTKGLNMPKFDRWSTASPSLAGSRYRGSRALDRSAMWPIFIWSESDSQEWLDRDRRFWRSLRPDAVGSWEIVTPAGDSRKLDLRFADDNDKAFGLDPSRYGWSVYAVDLLADDQPYWYGPDIAPQPFGVADDVPFFMTSGGVFNISPGGTIDSATITNPGDVDAWPEWIVNRGHAGATLGAGDGAVTLPAMGSGETWTIDTRPDRQTALDQAGVDHADEVDWNPAPIPHGGLASLDIALISPDADASVAVKIRPLYFRAW